MSTSAPTATPGPRLRFVRDLHVPRELVFQAWTRGEHVARWFAPQPLTVPDVRIEGRIGGAWDLTMETPTGERHRMEGEVLECDPPSRLVIRMRVFGPHDREVFHAHTVIVLTPGPSGGTRMEIDQAFEVLAPDLAHDMLAGAETGWASTLDNLGREIARMLGQTKAAPAQHGEFRIVRDLGHTPSRIWRAFTDPAAKARWFGRAAEGLEVIAREMDVRPGGAERLVGRWTDGTVSDFRAVYLDVVAERRLIYAYEMRLNDRLISVSLATLEIAARAGGARLTLTEQGAFLDGYEDGGARVEGTNALFDLLEAVLAG
jgi:uncharacterized protein YndB with AHSA1/START domain